MDAVLHSTVCVCVCFCGCKGVDCGCKGVDCSSSGWGVVCVFPRVLLNARVFTPHITPHITPHPTPHITGVLRASGQQKLGLLLNLTTYWVFGVPLCCVLSFVFEWNVAGLFAGLAIVTTVQCIVQMVLQGRIDWHKQAADAAARVDALTGDDTGHDVILAYPEEVVVEHGGEGGRKASEW